MLCFSGMAKCTVSVMSGCECFSNKVWMEYRLVCLCAHTQLNTCMRWDEMRWGEMRWEGYDSAYTNNNQIPVGDLMHSNTLCEYNHNNRYIEGKLKPIKGNMIIPRKMADTSALMGTMLLDCISGGLWSLLLGNLQNLCCGNGYIDIIR
jgi:hypothetical protein